MTQQDADRPDSGGSTPGISGTERYRVAPGAAAGIEARDPRDRALFSGRKDEGKSVSRALNARLEELQELLWAEGKHRLLVVLQAIDAGGKDGTIRHVFDGTNPQGVRVAAFKRPTARELAHDYLWRVHPHVPGDGEIAIFNRSHYEDVLVVRVHSLVPEEIWRRRYEHIAAFEKLLSDEGTTIVKFFLHISREEQKERFQARLDEPHKRWKFSRGDLDERARWDDYQAAFEEALTRTSADHAPWYVVPADRKWYRNLVVSQVLVDTLEGLDMRYPEPEDDFADVVID
jgi:PPK2 family polyphosphate:nucleotide phosphotransferase